MLYYLVATIYVLVCLVLLLASLPRAMTRLRC